MYSEDFSQSFWNKTFASVVSGFTSPNGTNNAYKLVEDTSTSNHGIYSNDISVTVGGNYTYSCYVKIGERSNIRLDGGFRLSIDATFNLNTLVVTGTGTIESLSNGWFRLTATGIGDLSTGGTNVFTYLLDNSGQQNYTGDGTSGVYIYGAQLEEGSYPTSYIPTSGSTVTRVADSLSQTFSNGVIGQTEGTMFAEVNISNIVNVSPYIVFRIYDGTTSNQIAFNIYPNGRIQTTVFDGGSLIVNIDNAGYGLTSGIHKFAIAYKENDYIVYIDGVLFGSDTSATVPTINTFDLTYPNAGSINYNQLQLYNTRLTNSELVTLTTI